MDTKNVMDDISINQMAQQMATQIRQGQMIIAPTSGPVAEAYKRALKITGGDKPAECCTGSGNCPIDD